MFCINKQLMAVCLVRLCFDYLQEIKKPKHKSLGFKISIHF